MVGKVAGSSDPAGRGRPMAPYPFLGKVEGPRLRGKRTRIIGLYTDPPDGATVVCADDPGPVIPRTFPPAPGWSPGGRRIKSELDYGRGPEKTWVYGGLRVRDGQQVTMTATSRNSVFYQQFLQKLEAANPTGDIYVITDNLSSRSSLSTRAWLTDHPRIKHIFIPVARAGSTSRKRGGGSSAKPPSPARPSPDPTKSPRPLHSPPPSSTAGHGPGSGADPRHPPDTYDAAMSTAFKERTTTGCLRSPAQVVLPVRCSRSMMVAR
ncbi:hypothetical protein SXANM310S_02606 [Streptomyces xanthochromogenes]